jgi:anion-transporting  ArsA/GET3 family ATPase
VPGIDGLDAMMLDMKRTFDEVIDRNAPDPERARRIKTNKFYRQLSDSLAGTQEYMATEKLHELHEAGTWECIVVDTPPTRNALDFLDAPRRLTDFLEGRFLRLFLAPGMAAGKMTARAAGFGASVFMRAMGRITGASALTDLAEFFQSFEGMYEGFKRRAQAVYVLLKSPGSAFVVVATPEPPALREARYFLKRLAAEGMPIAGLVVNRVTPEALDALGAHSSEDVRAAAARLEDGTPERRAASALLCLSIDRAEATVREARTISKALSGLDPHALVEIPLMSDDVHDLDGLEWLGARLTGSAA